MFFCIVIVTVVGISKRYRRAACGSCRKFRDGISAAYGYVVKRKIDAVGNFGNCNRKFVFPIDNIVVDVGYSFVNNRILARVRCRGNVYSPLAVSEFVFDCRADRTTGNDKRRCSSRAFLSRQPRRFPVLAYIYPLLRLK